MASNFSAIVLSREYVPKAEQRTIHTQLPDFEAPVIKNVLVPFNVDIGVGDVIDLYDDLCDDPVVFPLRRDFFKHLGRHDILIIRKNISKRTYRIQIQHLLTSIRNQPKVNPSVEWFHIV